MTDENEGIPASSKKSDLLKLPEFEWSEVGMEWYDSILVIPTRLKHDSGWSRIALVGARKLRAIKILAYPDDIHWPANGNYGYDWRMDSFYPSGVLRAWGSNKEFSVDYPTSSVEIKIRKKEA